MSEIKIDSSADTVENEKTKKQKEALQKAKEAKEAAAKEAEKERIKNALKQEIKEQASEQESDKKESSASAIAEGGASLVGALASVAADGIKSSAKTKGKGKFWLGIIIGLIVGALAVFLIGKFSNGMLFGTNHTTQATADGVLESGVFSYTAVDFQDAILGEASQHQELIVMEQPIEIATTITKAGLGNMQIFSKMKTITYYGTGVYTVNMAGVDADHIKVDLENKQVTLVIPHSCLQYINPDLDKTEFEDTEKGLLAFGDIKLKTEDQNRLLQSVYKSMEDKLKEEELFRTADEYASMSTWQMFQPFVTAVSPEFTLEIVFDETTSNQVTAAQE